MRGNTCRIYAAFLAALLSPSVPVAAATFGTVVSIGGQPSDLALDETRGLLYVSDFTANRVEVISTADGSLQAPIYVRSRLAGSLTPHATGGMSLSPDRQTLAVTNFAQPGSAPGNGITLIHLGDRSQTIVDTGEGPLGVTFLAYGHALVATTRALLLLDPVTETLTEVTTFQAMGLEFPMARELPAKKKSSAFPYFPSLVTYAQLASNAARTIVYGIATYEVEDFPKLQAFFTFDASRSLAAGVIIDAFPSPLSRLSVPPDGSWAMVGPYKLAPSGRVLSRYPNATKAVNIGGSAIDSSSGTIYAHVQTMVEANEPASDWPVEPPVVSVMDEDNLTLREKLQLSENLTGQAVLNAGSDILYAISDSGVTILPVGRLNQFPRVRADEEDVWIQTNVCDRGALTQTLNLTDPGGGQTDFHISAGTSGVRLSPASGVTPATVTIEVDPAILKNQAGTLTIPLTITSSAAVNVPQPVRLLVSNRSPEQRGTVVNVPGTLTDILADPVRNRFYVVRQDRNQIQVFDSTTYQRIATLRTGTTPTQMAFSFDRRYLVVVHQDAQLGYRYDLDTLQTLAPIPFPVGDYPVSIAESSRRMLAAVKTADEQPVGLIDSVDTQSWVAETLPALGIYENLFGSSSVVVPPVVAPAPGGGFILVAINDGYVLLYDATADTFTVYRQDFILLQGAYAASDFGLYVVGNHVLDSSLVPVSNLDTTSGNLAAFAFAGRSGFSVTGSSASATGVIERQGQGSNGPPTHMAEAPLLPTVKQGFLRTLAPLPQQSAVISLTVSGFTVVPWDFDLQTVAPEIGAVVSAADFNPPVAPGGLITVFGSSLSPVTQASSDVPLPNSLGEVCLEVNNIPVPLLYVSSTQINGQLPFSVGASGGLVVRTPGGVSSKFTFPVSPAAPSVFRTAPVGPLPGLPILIRLKNNQLVTGSNPVHPGDELVIYATGLGATSPAVAAGMPGPADPLATATSTPQVSLGGTGLSVSHAGLVPWAVGVYQINATAPGRLPLGLAVPLVISQGDASTTIPVRVVQ